MHGSQRDVVMTINPLRFFMNRFRLLERAPRAGIYRHTGLTEAVIRQPIDRLLPGYLTECEQYWQITRHGSCF